MVDTATGDNGQIAQLITVLVPRHGLDSVTIPRLKMEVLSAAVMMRRVKNAGLDFATVSIISSENGPTLPTLLEVFWYQNHSITDQEPKSYQGFRFWKFGYAKIVFSVTHKLHNTHSYKEAVTERRTLYPATFYPEL